ncbi:MAG: molybdopterin-dependent oxidoreductase [Proteobacteria bacterium]|nr:molybdopterin-dependent oxidoreductase [Pseudomonadota bacterium]
MNKINNFSADLSRRGFIKVSTAITGGLIVGVTLPALDVFGQQAEMEAGRLNGFVQIDPDETITITLHHAEMGQGIHTALPMIVAEELEADWTKIRVVKADARTEGGMAEAALGTGGSQSVRSNFEMLSMAGAAARDVLRKAAANRWGIPIEDCTARNGVVYRPDGTSASYGELVRGAAYLEAPVNPPLKDKSERRLIGKPMNRLDSP